MERRITTKTENDREDKLKHVAGVIQKLTYREMNSLALLIAEHTPNEGPDTITDALLAATDTILNSKETPRLG